MEPLSFRAGARFCCASAGNVVRTVVSRELSRNVMSLRMFLSFFSELSKRVRSMMQRDASICFGSDSSREFLRERAWSDMFELLRLGSLRGVWVMQFRKQDSSSSRTLWLGELARLCCCLPDMEVSTDCGERYVSRWLNSTGFDVFAVFLQCRSGDGVQEQGEATGCETTCVSHYPASDHGCHSFLDPAHVLHFPLVSFGALGRLYCSAGWGLTLYLDLHRNLHRWRPNSSTTVHWDSVSLAFPPSDKSQHVASLIVSSVDADVMNSITFMSSHSQVFDAHECHTQSRLHAPWRSLQLPVHDSQVVLVPCRCKFFSCGCWCRECTRLCRAMLFSLLCSDAGMVCDTDGDYQALGTTAINITDLLLLGIEPDTAMALTPDSTWELYPQGRGEVTRWEAETGDVVSEVGDEGSHVAAPEDEGSCRSQAAIEES